MRPGRFNIASIPCKGSLVVDYQCKRAILCLSSSIILTPHPPLRPASVLPPQQRRGVHTRWAERGVGGQYSGRRETQYCPLTVIISLRALSSPAFALPLDSEDPFMRPGRFSIVSIPCYGPPPQTLPCRWIARIIAHENGKNFAKLPRKFKMSVLKHFGNLKKCAMTVKRTFPNRKKDILFKPQREPSWGFQCCGSRCGVF